MTSYTVTAAHANLGRARNVRPVRESMTEIREALSSIPGPVILGLNEIDEGDKTHPTDHALLRQEFTEPRGWIRTRMSTREPILLHGIKPVRSYTHHASPGVPHQSPARGWQEDSLRPEPKLALLNVLCGHPPAGARNGRRPEHVRAELEHAYTLMETEEQRLLEKRHAAGHNVLMLADRNWRAFKPTHGQIVSHHGPDFITVFPAEGWRVVVEDKGWHPLSIEKLHGMSWVRLRYELVA